MTTISLRASTFGGPNASRSVDVFRVFVCSVENPAAVKAVGEAFTTAAEAVAAADALQMERMADLSTDAPEDTVAALDGVRGYVVASGTAAQWSERIEVRVRRAGSDEWVAI